MYNVLDNESNLWSSARVHHSIAAGELPLLLG